MKWEKKIYVDNCNQGIYLRWWFNGWHYFLFQNNYDVELKTEHTDIQVKNNFSIISKIEIPTQIKGEYTYKVTVEGIQKIQCFLGLLLAECVEQYEGKWKEVSINRDEFEVREPGENGFSFEFTISRKDLPGESAFQQGPVKLYINDVLCDLDDDEIVPVNKQVNDIADMQNRQSDFTYEFRVQKTRKMEGLFELSGEADSLFPYRNKGVRLVVEGVEVISFGSCLLNKVDSDYYYISVYSGNLDFFQLIENKKISKVNMSHCNHNWNAQVQRNSHLSNLDYIYPLCDPSDTGSILELTDDGSRVEVYGGWVWPFIRVKAIFDRIISETGYQPIGEILTDETFNKLFLPITTRDASYIDINAAMYNVHVANRRVMTSSRNRLDWRISATITSYFGDSFWKDWSEYFSRFSASYTFRVEIHNPSGVAANAYLYVNSVEVAEMVNDGYYQGYVAAYRRRYVVTYDLLSGDAATFWTSYNNGCTYYSVEVININVPQIAYGSHVPVSQHLPDITQKDFIKMICNLFCLIPEADSKSGTIRFWNYIELYDNIPKARDWSEYLSEADDEIEFRISDYAQKNYLKYKHSSDVIDNAGIGIIQVDDETLDAEKNVVELPFSTCDEVLIYDCEIPVSSIGFNKTESVGVYTPESKIDPRLVYVDECPPCDADNVLGFRTQVSGGDSFDVTNPKKASSTDIAFTSMSRYFDGLSHLLEKAVVRRCKFNLPAHEVAGLKHYIPIYLRQYGSYFYVNKIESYVYGRLCTVELIEL